LAIHVHHQSFVRVLGEKCVKRDASLVSTHCNINTGVLISSVEVVVYYCDDKEKRKQKKSEAMLDI